MQKNTLCTKESGSRTTGTIVLKAKIRERYKDVDPDKTENITTLEKAEFYHDDAEKRVAVYIRMHTDDTNLTSSYELQKNYYTACIDKHPNWHLVDIYVDEGMLKNRDQFNRMIEDCKAGKIDLIITKSISRFSRNIVECVSLAKMLRELDCPVGVYFEKEDYTHSIWLMLCS